MEVKGAGVLSVIGFVETKFPERFEEWRKGLPESSRILIEGKILANQWYPVEEAITVPMKKICEMFYGGSLKGAWEYGRYSSEKELTGIYKIFIKLSNVNMLIKKASGVFSLYYKPGRMELRENKPGRAILDIVGFEGMEEVNEYDIGGWIERSGEFYNLKNLSVSIEKAISKGDEFTRYKIEWTP